jgi:multicomponent Na+:H+ antiporter subunit D
MDYMIYFILVVPLFAALTSATVKRENIRDGLTIFIALILVLNVANLFLIAIKGAAFPVTLTEVVPGISIFFLIDPLGMLFSVIASVLWLATTVYAIGYMRGNKEKNQGRFFAFFAIAIFASMGIALAGNMFTLFLFYEILTICTFPLVAHHGTEEARKSGRIYLGILLGTSIGFQLTAIIWTWAAAGTLDFVVGGILQGNVTPGVAGALLFLYMFGVGKGALMPMHRWLPAAMVAPTPVSALLHAVAVVKAGVFTIIKVIVYIFGVDFLSELSTEHWFAGGWLAYVAGFTIISASVVALRAESLKRRLAYSTISQLSYIIMAMALFTPYGVLAAGYHVAAHAFSKITLFFAAGAIYTASKKKNISELDGIGKRMPFTMAAFTIGAISMIGVPPTAGFLSKYYLLMASFKTEHWFALGVILASTILNAMYFLPIIYQAYFKTETGKPKHKEAPMACLIAMGFTALMTIVLFIYPDIVLWLAALLSN